MSFVNIKMDTNLYGIFVGIYLSKNGLMITFGKQDLKCSGERQFCGSFYTFGMKGETARKITWRWEKARWGNLHD